MGALLMAMCLKKAAILEIWRRCMYVIPRRYGEDMWGGHVDGCRVDGYVPEPGCYSEVRVRV